MGRKLGSAEEIQQAVDARINAEQDLMKDHIQIKVPLPKRNTPDPNGCNWHMEFSSDVAGHEDTVSRVVAGVQGQYNLRE
jgi:hypothetical protein